MALPNPKRQKVNNDKIQIIFQSPGLQPDVRLKFFDHAEFHAHSVILKLYSAFFRKFLDSPDKAGAQNTLNGSFPYEWVTKIDDDGSWSLVAATAGSIEHNDLRAFKGDKRHELIVFEKFISAFYLVPYHIESIGELVTITEMADFYCSLPVLSRTLDSALIRSPRFANHLKDDDNASKALEIAVKIRNELLLRESAIWLANPWTTPKYKALNDPKLRRVAEKVRFSITATLSDVQHRINNLMAERVVISSQQTDNDFFKAMRSAASTSFERSTCTLCLPKYLRQLHTSKEFESIRHNFGDLFTNKLVLSKLDCRAGEGAFLDYFFCCEIDDQDMPWDLTQADW